MACAGLATDSGAGGRRMTTLKLEVVGPQAATLGVAAKIFHASGGTIGRLPDNDWMLPDPHISSRHARIHWRDGQFMIEDISSNGVFINSPDRRLARGQVHTLQSGDRIFIDAHEIRETLASSLSAADGSIPDDYDPLLDDVPSQSAAPFAAAPPSLPSAQHVEAHAPGGTLDFPAMLAGAGLHGVQVTPELAESFGGVLRIVVGGLMDVLRAREQIKNEFRLRMTTFKSADNNPLKFSANADDALHNLLVKRNSA